jgi:signal transduction histidine kinase
VRWAAKRRRVDVAVEGPSVALDGDEHALVRMFRNVLENAVRYSPEGGSVRISTEVSDADFAVTISDDGPGIPAEDREHVFTPFFRGRATRSEDDPGTGLGLAIAREIARHHGGQLTLVDPDRPGSSFEFRLPFPAPVARVPESTGSEGRRQNRRATA